jgi:hypothetical protein
MPYGLLAVCISNEGMRRFTPRGRLREGGLEAIQGDRLSIVMVGHSNRFAVPQIDG